MSLRLSRGVVRRFGTPIVNAIAGSWRFRVVADEHRDHLVESGRPFVFLLWHEVLLPLLWQHRRQGIAIVVSEGREGQYLADYAEGLGYRILPGSSTRGGMRALLGAMRVLRGGGMVAVTPDGPRGPRRVVKPGAVRAAQSAGAMILPVHAIVSRSWQLQSWDRMVIPRPRSRISVQYGEPFEVGPGEPGLGTAILQCATSLETLERTMLR
ncbi:MAG: lysophospholipid acyltransferase family protein [Gemmatimonadales bacterium]